LGVYQKWWFNSGIIIGWITALLVPFCLVISGKNSIGTIIPLVGLVNAYLLIIKGWLFKNDMERVIRHHQNKLSDIFTYYDIWYLVLIITLIIELICVVFYNGFITFILNTAHFNMTLDIFKIEINW